MSSSIFASVTAEKVRELRERDGTGLSEVRRQLRAEAANQVVMDLLEEGLIDHRLQQVLTYLVERRL